MILLIDNYDSFTYNLVNQIESLGVKVDVVTNDISPKKIKLDSYQAVVISPGPSLPKDSNNLNKIIDEIVGKIPVLGICLGMQALVENLGGKLKRLEIPYHGIVDHVTCEGEGIFKGLESLQQVVRYHSWVVTDLPEGILCSAIDQKNQVMAIESKQYQVFGIQFHPESILTINGIEMLRNWLRMVNIIPTY